MLINYGKYYGGSKHGNFIKKYSWKEKLSEGPYLNMMVKEAEEIICELRFEG